MKQSPAETALSSWLDQVGPTQAFAALADLVPGAAFFAVDGDRKVRLWSRGAEALLGYRAEEVVGRHCRESNRCHNCLVGCGLSRHGRIQDVPMALIRADGTAVAVRKTARAFFDENGQFQGGVEILVPDPDGAHTEAMLPFDVVAFHGLLSRDPTMLQAFETVRAVARTEATVLIRGESGTGKEGIARALHAESARKDGPFVAVNCAGLSPTLLESELFGHVRGAFTGAVRDHVGLFEQASGGTLFLDEVAELPLDVQARMLRVLQERVVTPVGGTKARQVDVRIVAATHRSLRALVQQGKFREDLMYRLRVVPIFLPPLRERRDDIPLLLWHLLEARASRGGRVVRSVAPEALKALLDHPWRGNVRELQNVVDYACAVGRGPELARSELPPELRGEAPPADGPDPGDKGQPGRELGPRRSPMPLEPTGEEHDRIAAALRQAQGHVGRAAALLGMSRPTFWRRRQLYPDLAPVAAELPPGAGAGSGAEVRAPEDD